MGRGIDPLKESLLRLTTVSFQYPNIITNEIEVRVQHGLGSLRNPLAAIPKVTVVAANDEP
jgi:hypothetical protein